MPSLGESQNRIDIYTNAGDWLRKSIAALKQLSENLDRARNIVESNYSINGNAPAVAERIKDLKAHVDDIERWNRDEILMHIDNEKRVAQQNYEAEQARIEAAEEESRRERERQEREAEWERERQRQEEEERRREQERREEEEARASAQRVHSN